MKKILNADHFLKTVKYEMMTNIKIDYFSENIHYNIQVGYLFYLYINHEFKI